MYKRVDIIEHATKRRPVQEAYDKANETERGLEELAKTIEVVKRKVADKKKSIIQKTK